MCVWGVVKGGGGGLFVCCACVCARACVRVRACVFVCCAWVGGTEGDDMGSTGRDDVQRFTVEFGVYGAENELQHCRTSRLYGEDGRLSSTSLAFAF